VRRIHLTIDSGKYLLHVAYPPPLGSLRSF
jgi:hypothetical protein